MDEKQRDGRILDEDICRVVQVQEGKPEGQGKQQEGTEAKHQDRDVHTGRREP